MHQLAPIKVAVGRVAEFAREQQTTAAAFAPCPECNGIQDRRCPLCHGSGMADQCARCGSILEPTTAQPVCPCCTPSDPVRAEEEILNLVHEITHGARPHVRQDTLIERLRAAYKRLQAAEATS